VPVDSRRFEDGESRRSTERRVLGLLQRNPERAYDVREVAVAVMDLGLSERNVERRTDAQAFVAEFVDVATVTTVLDRRVDRGQSSSPATVGAAASIRGSSPCSESRETARRRSA
jgi:hypothetical protein